MRNFFDYGCILYGSARKSYLQMLDPIHNQGFHFRLGAFKTSPVESLSVDAHEPCLRARRTKLSLQNASMLKPLPKDPAHGLVLGGKYVKLFHAKPNAIPTFGLRINQLLTASKTTFSDIIETPACFVFPS